MNIKYSRIAIIAFVALILTSCDYSVATEYEIGDDISYLKIGTNITKTELLKICEEFKMKKDINIDFSNSTFSSKGKIKSISLTVTTENGRSGSTSSSPFSSNVGFTIDDNTMQIGAISKLDW